MNSDERRKERRAAQRNESYSDNAKKLIAFYESRKLTGDKAKYEPSWTLYPFSAFQDYLDNKVEDKESVEEYLNYEQFMKPVYFKDFAFFGGRIIQEGLKVGTASWVFLGRSLPDSYLEAYNDEFVICGRKLDTDVQRVGRQYDFKFLGYVYIAYSLTDAMGSTALTANCYGPLESLPELKSVMNEQA